MCMSSRTIRRKVICVGVGLVSLCRAAWCGPGDPTSAKFIENKNQWPASVQFSAKIPGGNMVLQPVNSATVFWIKASCRSFMNKPIITRKMDLRRKKSSSRDMLWMLLLAGRTGLLSRFLSGNHQRIITIFWGTIAPGGRRVRMLIRACYILLFIRVSI